MSVHQKLSETGKQVAENFKEISTDNFQTSNIETETGYIRYVSIYEQEEYQRLISKFGEPKNRKQRRRYERLAKKNIEKSNKFKKGT